MNLSEASRSVPLENESTLLPAPHQAGPFMDCAAQVLQGVGAGDVRALARTTVSASLTAQNELTDTLLVGADTN